MKAVIIGWACNMNWETNIRFWCEILWKEITIQAKINVSYGSCSLYRNEFPINLRSVIIYIVNRDNTQIIEKESKYVMCIYSFYNEYQF
jgi:hypothetical protein